MNFDNFTQQVALQETSVELLLASCLGLLLIGIHSLYNNQWLRQKNTLIMALVLPSVSLVITKVIATNFSLSLGMIGALSIIRYRTPVKSNFELALLFGLITIGITVGVSPATAILLTLFICLIPLLVIVMQMVAPNLFSILPYGSEGRVECLMTDQKEKIDQIVFPPKAVKSIDVHMDSLQASKTATVSLIFSDMQEAISFTKKMENEFNVSSYSLREI